jgi:hypothetical protein
MNTDSCKILAQNLSDLINKSGRQLIDIHAQAQQAGILFNYPQLTKLSSTKSESAKNPTLETLEKVVEIFRTTVAPDLEMWMLLKEGYFSGHATPETVDPKLLEQYLNEFLFALTTMKVVGFTKEQYESALNVGRFCSLKFTGQSVMTPELAEKKG